MEIALSTHLFLYYGLLDGRVFGEISRAGFDAVELWAMRPHFPYGDKAAVKMVAEVAAKHGMKFRTAHLPMYEKVHRAGESKTLFSPSSPDPERRKVWREHTAMAIKSSYEVGARNFTLHTDLEFPGPDPMFDECQKAIEGIVRSDLPDGAVLSVENDVGGVEMIAGLLELIAGMDASKIGITLDLGHAFVGKSVVACIKKARDRIKVVHAHDNSGLADEHLQPGVGAMPWHDVFMALAEVNFTGPFVYEIRDPSKGSDPNLEKIIPILKETHNFDRSRQKS